MDWLENSSRREKGLRLPESSDMLMALVVFVAVFLPERIDVSTSEIKLLKDAYCHAMQPATVSNVRHPRFRVLAWTPLLHPPQQLYALAIGSREGVPCIL